MKKKLLALMLSAVMAVSVFTACGTQEQAEASVEETVVEEETTEEAVAEEETTEEAVALPTQDRNGNDIAVPENVEKIISMAPSTTQLLIDMGFADKIIACDTYSAASYGYKLAAEIPQFDMMSPDNEQIVALDPDIVFTTGMSYAGGEDVYAAVKAVDVCVADIPSSASMADIEADILFIGACLGADEKATEIVDEMEESIKQMKEIASSIPEEERKTVLYELSTPTADFPTIYSCGANTYIDEMITLVGAVNVAGQEESQWPALTEEAAIAFNPDVILSGDTYTPDVVNVILTTTGWENVNAIANGQVYAVDGDAMNRPNQHVITVMYQIAQMIYPEYFGEVEIPFAA
jgi:iron complex transport system substrate-binding protein